MPAGLPAKSYGEGKKSFVKLPWFILDSPNKTPDSIDDFSANAVEFRAWQKEGK